MTVYVFGPSAADSTWADAVDKIRKDLWRPSSSAIPDDQVDRALHSALLELEAQRRWLWLENLTGALTMPAALDNIALPASVKYVTAIAYLSGTTGYDPLDEKPVQFCRQSSRGSAAGFPTYYARSDKQLYFDCAVPADGQFELIFTSGCPLELVDAKDAPPITLTRQMPAIVAWAAHYVALTYLHDDEKARRQLAAYNQILDRLMLEEDTARADAGNGGCVQPDTYYYDMAHGS